MNKLDLKNIKDITFGDNVNIYCEEYDIKPGVFFGDNVQIESKKIEIGYDSIIEKNVTVRSLTSQMEQFVVGDNVFIGFSNQILVPNFTIMDFSQIHNSGLHSGYKDLTLGYNCWVGQNSILNATESLTIMNNVRIGTQSQLWTHVASGELIEGCTLFGEKPLVLEDNVWIVGGAVISPGLILRNNSIIMTGSVVTQDTEPYCTYAGVPAVNITDKLNCWKKIDIDEKYDIAKSYVDQFLNGKPNYRNHIGCLSKIDHDMVSDIKYKVLIVKKLENIKEYINYGISIFDISSKYYIKNRHKIELEWIKFNLGYRARFLPLKIIDE